MDFLLIDRGMGQTVVAGGSGHPRPGTIVFVCFLGGAGFVVDGCASSNKICRTNPKIEFVLDTEPRGFEKNGNKVFVLTENLKTKETKTLEADGIFIFVRPSESISTAHLLNFFLLSESSLEDGSAPPSSFREFISQ